MVQQGGGTFATSWQPDAAGRVPNGYVQWPGSAGQGVWDASGAQQQSAAQVDPSTNRPQSMVREPTARPNPACRWCMQRVFKSHFI